MQATVLGGLQYEKNSTIYISFFPKKSKLIERRYLLLQSMAAVENFSKRILLINLLGHGKKLYASIPLVFIQIDKISRVCNGIRVAIELVI